MCQDEELNARRFDPKDSSWTKAPLTAEKEAEVSAPFTVKLVGIVNQVGHELILFHIPFVAKDPRSTSLDGHETLACKSNGHEYRDRTEAIHIQCIRKHI